MPIEVVISLYVFMFSLFTASLKLKKFTVWERFFIRGIAIIFALLAMTYWYEIITNLK